MCLALHVIALQTSINDVEDQNHDNFTERYAFTSKMLVKKHIA